MKYLNYQNLALVAFISGIVFFISAHYVSSQQEKFGQDLIQMLSAKEAEVLLSAKSAKDSKLTESLAVYINDCSRESRQRFDASLDRLVNLPPEEIKELTPLFEACGPYFAKVKMALVNDLDREITELEKLLGLANVLGINDTLRVPLATWREYYEQQNTLAMALMNQYLIQVRINDLLISGVDPSHETVQTLVKEARLLAESAQAANGRSDQLFSLINP